MKRMWLAIAAVLAHLLLRVPVAEAAIVRGLKEIIGGVLQLPLSTLAGTFSGPPILGTAFGAINGTFRGISSVAHGALELAASGVAIAKTVAPFLLPFLL
jgi:hypothetical protein